MSSVMQRAIIFTSGSCRHEAAQKSQASAHALHASMHDWLAWLSIEVSSDEPHRCSSLLG
jgi:hypothetical protein